MSQRDDDLREAQEQHDGDRQDVDGDSGAYDETLPSDGGPAIHGPPPVDANAPTVIAPPASDLPGAGAETPGTPRKSRPTSPHVAFPQIPSADEPTVQANGSSSPGGDTPDQDMPQSIGPYQIHSMLGQGGMGAVYLAEQQEPVQRLVAIKLIHSSLNSQAARHRFAAERQAMARLSHPAIAQIFEAGTTDDGFPYFVMEHVPGEPLTSYCDRRVLSIEQRLDIFMDICLGVEHAHRKGILHRDLKPGNVLVAEVDGRPVPKIIDFGIAKALDRPLTEATLQTAGAIGTPSYMSPEALDGVDVDTRSDVYALGIMLFELLVGQKPFDLKGMGLAQIFQRIQETETPLPSQRYRTLPLINQEAIAEQRKQNRKGLQQTLQGDLDWILGMATAQERERRYGSASALADDVRRHLRDEPVIASPPSRSYRLGKFVRRNRGMVIAGVLALLALVGGTIGTTLNAVRAQREAIRANQEAERTRQALNDAEDVTRFLIDLFEVSDPKEAGGESLSARQLLDRGAERIRSELADQPLRRARMMHTMGTIYNQLQVHQEAKGLVEEALQLRQGDGEPLEVADSLYRLAVIERSLGNLDAAETAVRDALEQRRQAMGEDDPKVGEALRELAVVLYQSGRHDDAEPLVRQALAIAELSGTDTTAVADALETWGNLLKDQGRCGDAVNPLQRSLDIRQQRLNPLDPKLSYALNNLGSCYGENGQYDRARPLFEQSLKIQEKVLGPHQTPVAMARTNLSIIYRQLGELELAESALTQARDDLASNLGDDHPLVANCMAELGVLLWPQGRLDEAEEHLRQALTRWTVRPGPDHPWTAWAHWGLANVLRDAGRLQQAETHYRDALRIREAALPAGHAEIREAQRDYAKMLRQAGRQEDAEAMEWAADASSDLPPTS